MTVELDVAYTAERNRQAAVAVSTAAAIWRSSLWLDDPDGWLDAVQPIVRAGQSEQVALTSGYMSAKTEWATGTSRTVGLDPDRYTTKALRRKSFAEVYGRPVGATGYALAEGFDLRRAVQMGASRLARVMQTDMQMAQVHAARDWMSAEPTIQGYRRQIGSANPCGLCVGAATQRYRTGNLAPIHEHCHCTVIPMFGQVDPGRIIESDTWEMVKEQAEGRLDARDLSRFKISADELPSRMMAVRDPELGLRLVDADWVTAARLSSN